MAAALLAVLALGALVLDGRQRSGEVSALLARVEAGQATATYADRRLAATVEYASGALSSPSAAPAVRADLRRLVEREAQGRVPDLQRRRDAVADLRVLPWHREAREAREAYLAHLDARVAALEAVAADLRRLYQPRPEVDATGRDALAALLPLAPTPGDRRTLRRRFRG